MTLNSTGPISLAGTTTGQSIEKEIDSTTGGSATISLNDVPVRKLAEQLTGAVDMPVDFWGKTYRVPLAFTFAYNTANASLNVTAIPGYLAGKSDITITINTGIYVYSNAVGTPALTLTGGSAGDTITLVNNGYIMGKGGNGGDYTTGATGNAGGIALSLGFNATINNSDVSAYIGGGGGGGGGLFFAGTTGPSHGVSGGGGAGGGNGGGGLNLTPALGGGLGSSGASGSSYNTFFYGGGAGGRIFPSSTTTASRSTGGIIGFGGSGGGSGASWYDAGVGGFGATGGNGGGTNQAGGNGDAPFGGGGAGGGGGWGAAGGAGGGGVRAGGAGGKAVSLNGYTVTWIAGSTSKVYGAVS